LQAVTPTSSSSEDDSLSIVAFAGILEIKFLELGLEQLFVGQFDLVLSDQSWGEAAAQRVFDYLVVFAGTQLAGSCRKEPSHDRTARHISDVDR